MKICPNCGSESDDRSMFCPHCGSKLEESPASPKKTDDIKTEAPPEKRGGIKPAAVIAICAAVLVLGAGCFILLTSRKENVSLTPKRIEAEVHTGESNDKQRRENEDITGVDDTAIAESESARVIPLARKMLLSNVKQINDAQLVPSVTPFTVASDFSNVEVSPQMYLSDECRQMLTSNQFVVTEGGGSEFFEIYESNRYDNIPNFVTVDSLMHTYHLYFANLMKKTEKDYLSDMLLDLSERMLLSSMQQYDTLKGTEWEKAAADNVAFFGVGAALLGSTLDIPDYARNTVDSEIALIANAGGIVNSPLTGGLEDYSQYIPRGYYEGDPKMESYFRSMMWYGRINFDQAAEDRRRSALLVTLALDEGPLEDWEKIYSVTSFFAGASDDAGYYEYKPAADAAYKDLHDVSELAGNTEGWKSFSEITEKMSPPSINSIPMEDDGGATDKREAASGFRFMGQRFSIDGVIFQNLIHSEVEDRMLPDVLDVPAVLGSDTALDILNEHGDTSYEGYSGNMEKLRTGLNNSGDELWNASLYSGWLGTLRPILKEKGAGYPSFMQSDLWRRKELETFAGSFTELKHDTVLYSKQAYAEMGDGELLAFDDRGYVEPEPEVYSRFAILAEKTKSGLAEFGMISSEDAENLEILSQLARQFMTISEKELTETTLTDDEYELIRNYGGNLEHFWINAMKGITGKEDRIITEDFPAALVTDVATDPSGGTVLELGTGTPSTIYVVVDVDGKHKVARGSVYDFYQFEWPLSDRLTDSKWRKMIGAELGDDGYYNRDNPIEKPEWTEGYRYKYSW